MIKKFETEDIAKIMLIDHTGEHTAPLPCEKGQWVQFLLSQVENPKMYIAGEIKDNQIKGYIVLIDNILPPVFFDCVLFYLWSPSSHKITLALTEAGQKWKEEIGARRGLAVVPLSHSEKYMSSFGGRLIANVYEF